MLTRVLAETLTVLAKWFGRDSLVLFSPVLFLGHQNVMISTRIWFINALFLRKLGVSMSFLFAGTDRISSRQ